MAKIYKQWDSRYGYLKYPYGSKTLASSGCGCLSVYNILIEKPYYHNLTVKRVRDYMVGKGYAIYGNGTARSGVAETLEHFGFTVRVPDVGSTMKYAFEYLAKSKEKSGVILFKAGTRGSVTWTGCGHYVAFVDYKVKNGKHYFKMKDSGRWNDGWFCYETTMRGLIPWMCINMEFKHNKEYPKLKRTKGYPYKLPTETIKYGSKGKQVKRWQRFLKWTFKSKKLKVGGGFKSYTEYLTMAFQYRTALDVDGIVGKKTRDKAKTFKKRIKG